MQNIPYGTPDNLAPAPAQKRPRLYYGWVIVLVSSLADMMSYGGGPASFSVFLKPMSESLGWSRTVMTGAASLQSVGNSIIGLIVGPLLDRHGPRMIMAAGAGVAAVCFVLMGRITEPWQFYILFTTATAFGLHEVGSFITNATVSKWFVRRRGRALAITVLGNDIGVIVMAPFIAFLIESNGWRFAWGALGILIAVVVIPPTLLFMRRSPEDMGLLPDGDAVPVVVEGEPIAHPRPAEPRWTVREAFRERTTWLLVIALNLASMAIGAMLFHQVAFFTDLGLSLQEASFVFAVNRVAAMGSKITFGFVSEHVPVRFCLMVTQLGRAAGILILLIGTVPERVYAFAVVSGLIGNAWGPMQNQLWADYYGRAFIGSIRGALAPFSLISNLGGTLFAAVVYDAVGSYSSAFWIFTVALFVSSAIVFFLKPPGMEPSARDAAATTA